ncbi:WD40 repeat-like protein [Suillus weaverae]|nr:WD40 repeat-like protein [Suillus weaverae]
MPQLAAPLQQQLGGLSLQQSFQQHNQARGTGSAPKIPWTLFKSEKKQYDQIFRTPAGTGEHIIVWNTLNGKELLKIEQQEVAVAFIPDSLRLVSGCIHDIRISDAATGDIIKQFEAHTELFQSLAIAPDGTKVASTSIDSTTRFFDLTTFEPIGEPLKHPDAVYCVAFSDNGQLVATGCDDALLRVWAVPQSDSDKESKQPQKDDRRHPRPSIPIEIIPRLESRPARTGIPRGFFDDAERTYPPRRSADGGSQHPTRHSRIKDFVNRPPFRRQLQQAQPEGERSHHWNGSSQFLRQRLSFRRSRPSQESQEVEVAAGRKFTRLAVVKLPEYKKVNDTRHLLREQPGVSQSTTNDQCLSRLTLIHCQMCIGARRSYAITRAGLMDHTTSSAEARGRS